MVGGSPEHLSPQQPDQMRTLLLTTATFAWSWVPGQHCLTNNPVEEVLLFPLSR